MRRDFTDQSVKGFSVLGSPSLKSFWKKLWALSPEENALPYINIDSFIPSQAVCRSPA